MRTRNLSSETSARRWLPAGTLGMVGVLSGVLAGCPNQELAPLTPCTVSGVSLEVPQTGVDKVDLLFMIDNSGSMAEEQKKLSEVLPDMVRTLTTGQIDPANPKPRPDFPPVKSLHIGVISSDLGVNLAPSIESCGGASYNPIAPDPANNTAAVRMMPPNGERLDKPHGDNGQLLIDTKVAQAGIWSRPFGTTFSTAVTLVVDGDPRCANINLPQRFINFDAPGNPDQTSLEFSCIAKLGKNGCGLEQQLESVYKALAPTNVSFSRGTTGQGTPPGTNTGFLREDAVLTVVLVTDEEDCSIPDQSSELFNRNSTSFMPGDINTRCGKPENQQYLHPLDRYIKGLKALKSEAFQDRIIFAAIAGIPLSVNLNNVKAHSGPDALNAILARPDMQFMTRPSNISNTEEEPVPVCISPSGAGSAAPARRFVQTASAFGENGVVTSICENEYGSALDAVITKIAAQLSGACLPRQLRPVNGKVECDVVEIKSPTDTAPCDPAKGRTGMPSRRVLGSDRIVCAVNQVGVTNGQLELGGAGWYYDNFTDTVKQECQTNPQRIAFTPGAETSAGAQARFECFQPVAPAESAATFGQEAVNIACTNDGTCAAHNGDGYTLICVGGGCQIQCTGAAACPDGWHCVPGDAGRDYCVNPTCPPANSTE